MNRVLLLIASALAARGAIPADSARGERLFETLRCTECHNVYGTGGAAMVAALWSHGPQLLEQMTSRRLPWPRFERTQMANLIAYLGSSRTGK